MNSWREFIVRIGKSDLGNSYVKTKRREVKGERKGGGSCKYKREATLVGRETHDQ